MSPPGARPIEPAPELLTILAGTFLLAGLVKGVIGLGLPTVSLGLLTATLGLTEAMALMVVPSLVTNLWQALSGGALGALLRRLGTALVAAGLAIWAAAGVLARADTALLAGLLGLLLCAYAAFGLGRPKLPGPGAREAWLSPLVGAVTGALTGLTGSFVVPAVPYLQALGLGRDALIQAMGIWFTVSTLVLAAALGRHDLLTLGLSGLSAAAVVPALLGMWLGQRLRGRLSEEVFRKIFFCALFALGALIAGRAAL